MFAIYKWNKIVQIKFNIRCITKKKTHIFTCAHMYTHSQLPSVSQKRDLLFFCPSTKCTSKWIFSLLFYFTSYYWTTSCTLRGIVRYKHTFLCKYVECRVSEWMSEMSQVLRQKHYFIHTHVYISQESAYKTEICVSEKWMERK